MTGSCDCGNETSGSVKCREISGLAENLSASQEGCCDMGLVR